MKRQKLIDARNALGLTRAQMAARCGVCAATIRKLENGTDKGFMGHIACRLAKGYGVKAEDVPRAKEKRAAQRKEAEGVRLSYLHTGEQLQELRYRKGMSMRDMAAACGMSHESLRQIESHDSHSVRSEAHRQRILLAYGVDIAAERRAESLYQRDMRLKSRTCTEAQTQEYTARLHEILTRGQGGI